MNLEFESKMHKIDKSIREKEEKTKAIYLIVFVFISISFLVYIGQEEIKKQMDSLVFETKIGQYLMEQKKEELKQNEKATMTDADLAKIEKELKQIKESRE